MARALEARFFECPDCNRCSLLVGITSEDTCPNCGSPNGEIISVVELRRRIETGSTVNVDFSPGVRAVPRRM
jgi:hypothetical protein